MRLDQVPEDVLILIFVNFCFHCQNPGHFTNADLPEVVQNKRTLAYLCRTSRALCDVAQPVLYHYYATGNLDKGHKKTRHLQGAPWEHDFFPQFLRTILVRQDLATHVRSLQISPPRALWHGVKLASIYAGQADILDLLLKWATERNLLPWRVWRLGKRNRPIYTANEPLNEDELLLLGLQCMTRVHTLLLSRSHDATFDFTLAANENEHNFLPPPLPLITLPSLKTLGLVRASNDFKLTELGGFFRAAMNLETLYACDGGGWSLDTSEGFSVACEILGLFRLRKLVIDSLSTISFGELISSLAFDVEEVLEEQYPGELLGLQDLEYYWAFWHTYDVSLDWVLQLLRNTLKRLCLAYLPRSKHADDDEFEIEIESDLSESNEEYDEWPYDPPDVDYDPISSLATFPSARRHLPRLPLYIPPYRRRHPGTARLLPTSHRRTPPHNFHFPQHYPRATPAWSTSAERFSTSERSCYWDPL